MVHGVVEKVHLRREPIPIVDELSVLEGEAVADAHDLTVHGERLEIEVGGVQDGPIAGGPRSLERPMTAKPKRAAAARTSAGSTASRSWA